MHVDELLDEHELDCSVNTDDYNTLPLLRPTPPVEPTYSIIIVELSKPRGQGQVASDDTDYDQVTDTDHLPGVVEFEFMVKNK